VRLPSLTVSREKNNEPREPARPHRGR
jgi:hypothetical protein